MGQKKKGMLTNELERKSGNFPPSETYDGSKSSSAESRTKPIENSQGNEIHNNSPKILKSNDHKNQKAQLKISKSLKNEILGIKALTGTKYEYEVIQLLIDTYKKTLSPEEIKKLRLINELNIN